MNHLAALELRLSHERNYLALAKTDGERALREVWISQIKKEIEEESKFIVATNTTVEMSDDELLAALEG